MATCLIALGSNLGDRAATLQAAVHEIGSAPGVRLLRHSRWWPSRPVGGPTKQPEFLNAAALVETGLAPPALLEQLIKIESQHGRQRGERWGPRTLDVDLLLYDEQVIDSPPLVIPHPRMSFRPFVLAPAAEIAGDMIHPTLGWSIHQLLTHLEMENERVAIVSFSDELRRAVSRRLIDRFRGHLDTPALSTQAGSLWPQENTAWISFAEAPGHAALNATGAIEIGPKLTILLDGEDSGLPGDGESEWRNLCQQPGRGPTLQIGRVPDSQMECEIDAAIEAVWPDLGRHAAKRVE